MSNEHVTIEQVVVEEGGIDLVAVVVALLSEWRIGLITFVIVSLLCGAYVYSLKAEYVAVATILPQEARNDTSNLAGLFTTRGPGTLYTGLLESRTVKDYVVEHANLQQLFHTGTAEDSRNVLSFKSTFLNLPNTLLSISVRDTNAQDAARIANTYLDALANLNTTMAFQQSSQTTAFFESQLDKERDALSDAEAEFARLQKRTGLIDAGTQLQIGLGTIAGIRADIKAREVQLAALLQSQTEQNPNVQNLRTQIAALRAQEARQEQGGGVTPAGAAPSAGSMPESNLDIARAQGKVRYHEALVSSLSNQYEASRLNESFRHSAFQVVDRAVPPQYRAWPPRQQYMIASLAFGAVMGFIAILIRLLWKRISSDAEHRAQLARLARAFGRG